MAELGWCLKQKKGIELVEPNDNLGLAYLQDAKDSLESLDTSKGMWRTVIAYYACYYALYALLMKVGLKCEIHDCTLILMQFFDFNEEEKEFMEMMKNERIGVQYYRKEAKDFDIGIVKSFVVKCNELYLKINGDEIQSIRGLVKND